MRKGLIVLLLAAFALAGGPANAKLISKKTLKFEATVPCAVAACTYWQPHAESPGTFAILPELAGQPGMEKNTDAAYEKQSSYACTHPGVEGSYDDVVVKAPLKAKFMRIDYRPDVDWDMWLCAKPARGNNGRMLAHETVDYDNCADPAGVANCPSTITTRVKPGQKVVVRAYNFSDPSPLSANLRWYT